MTGLNRVSAVLLGMAACSFSFAQAPVESDTNLDQIVVTGARTPISLNRIGNATTVITRDQIDRMQARYVADVLRTVPGFSISQSGGIGTQTQVRVRGAEANHVLVLIDGIRANDPATGDEFRWEYLTTGDIVRIRVAAHRHLYRLCVHLHLNFMHTDYSKRRLP